MLALLLVIDISYKESRNAFVAIKIIMRYFLYYVY